MVKNSGAAGAYVVVHTGVDNYRAGQVVKPTAFKVMKDDKEVYDGLERLIGLGAVRPATDEEASSGQGFAAGVPGLSLASQMRLATLDAEVDRLRRVIGDQKERIDFFERSGVADETTKAAQAAEEAAANAVLEQRRAEVDQLKKQAQENHARLEALARKGAEKGKEEREKADPELSGSAGPPFGEGAEGGGGEGGHHRRRKGGGES